MQPQKWTLAKVMREGEAEKGKEVRRGRGRESLYLFEKIWDVQGNKRKEKSQTSERKGTRAVLRIERPTLISVLLLP